ncbi:hypothetical protein HK096_006087, partial [Nowakowskiella sp. JEL0078]
GLDWKAESQILLKNAATSGNFVSNPTIAFVDDILFSASSSNLNDQKNSTNDGIRVWRVSDGKILLILPCIVEPSNSESTSSVIVTSLKVNQIGEGQNTLCAGFSNGLLKTWKFSQGNHKSTPSFKEIIFHSTNEFHQSPITSITMIEDIIMTISFDCNLRIYLISKIGDSGEWSCKLIHQLKSVLSCQPADLHLRKSNIVGDYIAYVCYSSKQYGGGWEVATQEIRFNTQRILESTHHQLSTMKYCKPKSHSTPVDAFDLGALYDSDSDNESYDQITQSAAPATCIRIRPPYMLTGTASNTVDVYVLIDPPLAPAAEESSISLRTKKKMLHYATTLYGHAAAVTALSLNEQGRLVSGAADGIKIWDLATIVPIDNFGIREDKERDTSIGYSSKRKGVFDDICEKNIEKKKSRIFESRQVESEENHVTIMDNQWRDDFSAQTIQLNELKTDQISGFSSADVRSIEFNERRIVSVHGGCGLTFGTNEYHLPVVPGFVKVFSFCD